MLESKGPRMGIIGMYLNREIVTRTEHRDDEGELPIGVSEELRLFRPELPQGLSGERAILTDVRLLSLSGKRPRLASVVGHPVIAVVVLDGVPSPYGHEWDWLEEQGFHVIDSFQSPKQNNTRAKTEGHDESIREPPGPSA